MKTLLRYRLFTALLLFFFLLNALPALGQQKFTLSGYVRDAGNSETLLGASVYLPNNKSIGTSTNLYGFYSITMPTGTYTVEVSFLGYNTQQATVTLTQNQTLNIDLVESGVIFEDAVVITSTRQDQNVKDTDMGRMDLYIIMVTAF